MKSVIEKYLAEYGDPRALPYAETFQRSKTFGACVVVPAFNESEYLLELIQSLELAAEHSSLQALLIVVLNHKDSTPEEQKLTNRRLLDQSKTHFHPSLTLRVLDFVSKGKQFANDEGVGHARKIGSDLALRLHTLGILPSPFFHTTDGDAVVPRDYFEMSWTPTMAAKVANYKHTPSGDFLLDEAHTLYEFSLRHYEAGLAAAGSPYAFPTIGSLLTISYLHYAMVRGFPKRLAAEDFYILNKLAKVGSVEKRETVVSLRARPSDRVPFGTGMGVADILETGIDKFKVYNPKIFDALKTTLDVLNDFPNHRSLEKSRAAIEDQPTFNVLTEIGFWQMLEDAARTRPSSKDCQRHLTTAFDAFKTLKFVHGLTNSVFPKISKSHFS